MTTPRGPAGSGSEKGENLSRGCISQANKNCADDESAQSYFGKRFLLRPGYQGRPNIAIHVGEIDISVRWFRTARFILDRGKGFIPPLRREHDLPALAGPRLDQVGRTVFRTVAGQQVCSLPLDIDDISTAASPHTGGWWEPIWGVRRCIEDNERSLLRIIRFKTGDFTLRDLDKPRAGVDPAFDRFLPPGLHINPGAISGIRPA